MTEKNLKEIAGFEDQFILSDEIYHGLVYEGRARSILEFTDRAFVINGFSKLYAMTGWRLGYLIFPKEFSRVMERLHQNFAISANSFVQVAGIAALRHAGPDIEKMKRTYNERRVYMIGRLRELGFGIHVEPTGAFYVFADARHFCTDSYKEAFRYPGHRQGGGHARDRFRLRRRGLSPVLVRELPGEHQGGAGQGRAVSEDALMIVIRVIPKYHRGGI